MSDRTLKTYQRQIEHLKLTNVR